MCGHVETTSGEDGFAEAIVFGAFFATKLIWCDNFNVSSQIRHPGGRRVWWRMLGTLV